MFGADTVFDLIDRPFDVQEPGVARLNQVIGELVQGQVRSEELTFTTAAGVSPLAAHCSLHLLADGRQGVLVVQALPAKPAQDAEAGLAALALGHLPVAVLLLSAQGGVLHANAAARGFFKLDGVRHLVELFTHEERAAALLRQISGVSLTGTTEQVQAQMGVREARLTLARLPDSSETAYCLTAEDVTDRRALERDVQFASLAPAVALPPPPVGQTQDKAFAQLARSLQGHLNGETVQAAATAVVVKDEKPARPAATDQKVLPPSEPLPAKTDTKPRTPPPPVPAAIRQSLEVSGQAVVIGRGSDILFATRKAVEFLGYPGVDALYCDGGLCALLRQGELPARPQSDGPAAGLSVTHCSVPWLNGPAEQFVLKPMPAKVPALPAADNVAGLAAAKAARILARTASITQSTAQPTAPAAPAPAVVTAAPATETEAPPAAPADVTVAHSEVIAAQELKALLDVASDGIIGLDGDGNILSFSAGAEAIFGLRRSEAEGRAFASLLVPDCRKAFLDYLSALSGPGLATVFNDGREVAALVQPDGQVPLFLTLGRLQATGSKAAFCAVVRDITQWKRTEQDLRDAKEVAERANRKKSDFLAAISHELRTPLNAILGFSEMMQSERFGALKSERYRAYANDIHTSGTHLLSLVNDLLDLTKVEAGKMELDFTAVSASDLVEHAVRLLQEEASRSGVILRKVVPPGLPRIVADLRAMRQVLLNILSNAIKYTDAGGQVIVSALMDASGEVVLRVSDTGIGMNDAQMKDALEPFSRVESATRVRQGTGLGLPLSKALAEANRAVFTMVSEAGKGTSVEIRFPAARVLAE
jgi:PAS domain S-box-containing protein